MRRRALLVGAATTTLMTAAAAPAFAGGGDTIASATPVTIGQQQFGNLSGNHSTSDDPDCRRGWWLLPVTSGDQVTIDWESPLSPWLNVFPIGTTDFTFPNAEQTVSEESLDDGTHKDEVSFTAPQTGPMPVEFYAPYCDTETIGPYDFTVYLKHALRLSLPPTSALGLSGALPVPVHNPDGAPISGGVDVAAQVLAAGGSWVTIGHAAPSGGVANIGYAIPSTLVRRTLRLRAIATGAAYTTETTSAQKVALPPALQVHLPAQGRISRKGKLRVSALGYDGSALSDRHLQVVVELRTARGWKPVGSRWVEGSIAPVRLHLSRRYTGRRVTLRARVAGDYPRQVSAKRRYRVRRG